MTTPFVPFPKLARLKRGIVITEKLDGTNAQVWIGPGYKDDPLAVATWTDETMTDIVMLAGSRNRWIVPGDDNYGFAAWVRDNAEELAKLGPGSHFGEWWGRGIQRGYGLDEKRFSLFNTARWKDERPACCGVVPVLYDGDYSTDEINATLDDLRAAGSWAAPNFAKPEGIVIYHSAARAMFKVTLDNDAIPKGLVKEPA